MAAQGFVWRYNISGGRALVQTFLMKDSETFTKGDMMNLESGEVDLFATGGDTDGVGVFLGPDDPADATVGSPGVVAGTDSTTLVKVQVNPDAVYADVNDTNARLAGAELDITGTTGAQTLGADGDSDVLVVERKRQNADETRFIIQPKNHFLMRDR
ncbi:hypothetical protein CMI37_14435 [Candidatus Pacearchaeota archaeon]|nr:hypothetical protein [Candidatus Pacearchaeota archaeon]|tara:strand:+ start:601 stop:1071 length:471 start_codon:yes stop_codon:yes gene_type:complete